MSVRERPGNTLRARRRAVPAFTLVESVAAGSVLLFALVAVVPTARSVRARDQLSGCLANMRAIGQASRAYAAADPHELLIPVAAHADPDTVPTAFDWGGKSGAGQSSRPWEVTLSMFGTASYRGPAHRPLNAYIYKSPFPNYNPVGGTPNPGPGNWNFMSDTMLDLDVYRCPADTGYAGGGYVYTAGTSDRNEIPFRDEGRTAYDHYGTSYNANVWWIAGCSGGSQLRSGSAWFRPLSQVPYPAASIIYQEVPSRWLWIWGNWNGSGCEWTNYAVRVEGNFSTVPGWHARDFHATVAFADGRSALVKMQGCTRPAQNLGVPIYPPNECSSSVDPYECLRCVQFRGADWQLDVLPAPPVPTPWYAEKSGVRSADLHVIP